MVDAIDKAVRAQGGAVVKPHQVKAMILAARRAYSEQAKAGLVDDGVDFDAWRRATLHDVVGAAAPDSFRAVTQRDYAAVMDYFGRLAGDRPAGNDSKRTTASDAERRALWALNLEEGEVAGLYSQRNLHRTAGWIQACLLHRAARCGSATALPPRAPARCRHRRTSYLQCGRC